MSRPPIHVVGAVIVRSGKVLCTQRGPGHLEGLWEFPGGKVETGETPQAALVREIREELRCSVEVGDEVTSTSYEQIVLTTYRCRLLDGTPELVEHTAMRWLAPEDLDELDWAPADVPAVALLRSRA